MNLRSLLDEHFGTPIDTNHELRYICPFCGSPKQKLFVNNEDNSPKQGMWICFECGEHGNLVGLLSGGLGISYSDAKQMIADSGVIQGTYNSELSSNENILLALNHREYSNISPYGFPKPPRLPPPELPHGLHYFREGRKDAKPFIEYLSKRGFSEELVTKLGYGYIKDGYAKKKNGIIEIHDHVVFITYYNGNYVYWNTRSINNGIPKSINAPSNGECLGKGDVVYNRDIAEKQPVMILTEGVPDALTLYPYGVATFGKMITGEQLGLISIFKGPVLVMLDMDAKNQLIDVAKKLYQYNSKVRMVFNKYRKDANSLGRVKALNLVFEPKNLIIPDEHGILDFSIRYRRL